MRESFKNAEIIVGIDIDPACKDYEDVDNNIFIEIGDATDKIFIDYIIKKYGQFDIILDDGSHVNRDMIKSFEQFFPYLNDKGLYVVEDTICYKSKEHNDFSYPNILEYFFNFTKYLNQWRRDSTRGPKDHCVDPFKIMKKAENIFEASIDKIEYGCSFIAIHKQTRKHWI
jgi:hypothetical protein